MEFVLFCIFLFKYSFPEILEGVILSEKRFPTSVKYSQNAFDILSDAYKISLFERNRSGINKDHLSMELCQIRILSGLPLVNPLCLKSRNFHPHNVCAYLTFTVPARTLAEQTRHSVAVQRHGIPVEKDTWAKDLSSDLVHIVNTHDMIASVCEMLNGV